jgi:hypothetical protein
MTIAHLHNCLRRSTHPAAVFTPPGTFDHEVDGKLVEGTGEIGVHYFSSETCRGGLPYIPRKSEMRTHNTARTKGAFMASKLYIKSILTV